MSSKKEDAFMARVGRGIPQTTLTKVNQPVRRWARKQQVEKTGSGPDHPGMEVRQRVRVWRRARHSQEAALRAGYPEKRVKYYAESLTNPDINPHIVSEIQRLRAEMAEQYGTTYERHMRDLQVIRDQALSAGAFGAAVQAEYRRGQALGTIYIDRKEIRHGTIDSMSKEEVQRKLDELKKLYGGPPPTALIDADTGIVIESAAREKDPEFDAGVEQPPPDFFERDLGGSDDT